MGIEIKVTDLDTMATNKIRDIGGMFMVFANYIDELVKQHSQQPQQPQQKSEMPPAEHLAPEQSAPETPPEIPQFTQPNGIEVDSSGLPWDGRIHSSNKSRNENGTWRLKRGVDKEVVIAVETELRQVLAVPKVIPEIPLESIAPPPPFVSNAVPPAPPVNIIPGPSIPAGVVSGASHSSMTFPQFMPLLTKAVNEGQFDFNRILAVLTELGVPTLPALNARPDLIPEVAKRLGMTI